MNESLSNEIVDNPSQNGNGETTGEAVVKAQAPDPFDLESLRLSQDFAANAQLVYWKSVRPLLKRPLRNDIRLYFYHRGAQAWRDKNQPWVLKLP